MAFSPGTHWRITVRWVGQPAARAVYASAAKRAIRVRSKRFASADIAAFSI